jgi:uncharacterized protein
MADAVKETLIKSARPTGISSGHGEPVEPHAPPTLNNSSSCQSPSTSSGRTGGFNQRFPHVNTINVQVVYAMPDRQDIVSIKLPQGAVLKQALEACGLLQKYPEIDAENGRFGIFSRLSKPDTVLRDLDRVEIYRPLIADPKEVRRQRAAAGKVMKKGAGTNA